MLTENNKGKISIHALRVEGDQESDLREELNSEFLSTPSGWRATGGEGGSGGGQGDFYPRPPGGGRPASWDTLNGCTRFLSTPSGWRATVADKRRFNPLRISIHALRVEGDPPE